MQGIWALCVFQVGLCASPYLVKNGDIWLTAEGLGPRVMLWQRQSGCQFVVYLAYIIGSKFEQHHLNISRDIQDFVINFCTYTICDVINFWTKTWISLEREKIIKNRKRHSCSLWEAFQIRTSFFHFVGILLISIASNTIWCGHLWNLGLFSLLGFTTSTVYYRNFSMSSLHKRPPSNEHP